MGKKKLEKLRKNEPSIKDLSDDEKETANSTEEDLILTKSKRTADTLTKEDDESAETSGGGETKRKRIRKRKSAAANDDSNDAGHDNAESNSTQIDSGSGGGDRFTNSATVYIEGLPFDATESAISNFFSSAGQVKAMRLPRWHDSGRLRGYGHVEFCDPAGAVKALEMDGSYMGKRFIKVDRPMTPRIIQQQQRGALQETVRPAGCKTIFVKNLPYDCEEQDVSNAFMFCGKITKVRLAVWGHTNQLKGFGYVEFKSEESAGIAVKKSLSSEGIAVKGRPVICDFETGQPKGSFKPRTSAAQTVQKS